MSLTQVSTEQNLNAPIVHENIAIAKRDNNEIGNSENTVSSKVGTIQTADANICSTSDITNNEGMRILDHLKSMKVINDKRREFINSTLVTEPSSSKSCKGDTLKLATENGIKSNASNCLPCNTDTTNLDNSCISSPIKPLYEYETSTLNLPKSPPPKPPMLSRTRSLEHGSHPRTSPSSQTLPTLNEPYATLPTTKKSIELLAVNRSVPVITSSPQLAPGVPGDEAQNTNENGLKELSLLRNRQLDSRTNAEDNGRLLLDVGKAVAANHYECLIEELRCPGCTLPMKAPTLLCKMGHSICEQCTRVLMTCPLCREAFTNIRSLTIEALCSKAHFRCANSSGGCTVRLHLDLLSWHEKQCIYKPMTCFMGRVWGDCQWSGREIGWREHLEKEHRNKVFANDSTELIWNMGVKQKPLTGYYVFDVFDEMFNFYEIYDKERVLFTMTITSTVKEKKYNFAYEVSILQKDNEALCITVKFPVHSEYDSDILQEGTCASILLSDLAKFIDKDRLLHYRVRVLEIKTPRQPMFSIRHSCPPQTGAHVLNSQQTEIEGVNMKNVPNHVIVTRRQPDLLYSNKSYENSRMSSSRNSENDFESYIESDAFIARRWGTPQMHFHRKYLRTLPSDVSPDDSSLQDRDIGESDCPIRKDPDAASSITNMNTSYTRRMTDTLRKSFRHFRDDFKSLSKKSVDKLAKST